MFLFKKKNMYVNENGAYNPPGQHMIILNDSLTLLCIVLFPFVVLSELIKLNDGKGHRR